MQAGHDNEPITLYRYLLNHDKKTTTNFLTNYYKQKQTKKVKLFTEFKHPEYSFMFCHPDMIHNDLINVEAKYVKYRGNEWDFYDLTENGIPFKYYLQVQFQMMCTGLKTTTLVCNYLGADHYEFIINANEDLFETLQKIAHDFWKLVQRNEPPMPQNRKDIQKLFKNKNEKSFSVTNELEYKTIMQKDRFNFLKSRIKKLDKEKKSIQANVMSLMGKHNILQTSEGEQIAKISSYEVESITALKEIKENHKRVYKYLEKNGMIKKSTRENFYF